MKTASNKSVILPSEELIYAGIASSISKTHKNVSNNDLRLNTVMRGLNSRILHESAIGNTKFIYSVGYPELKREIISLLQGAGYIVTDNITSITISWEEVSSHA